MIYPTIKKFLGDERGGAVTAFIVVMFMTMFIGGGMGVDFMRHESERVTLQDSLDRGVLAAASFEQEDKEMDIESLVVSYIRSSDLLRSRDIDLSVTSDLTIYSREVVVTGSYEINTFFLKLAGIPTLSVEARSSAKVSRGEVEISLILDNSGSMGWTKMNNLKDAANTFIDLVLNDRTFDHTTISLVPFTAQVNAGPLLASKFNLDVWHDYSWCFAFDGSEYNTTALSQATEFVQEQHYYRGSGGTHECPPSTIVPFSNDPDQLHAAINNMRSGGYTATYAGMKWGTALLDPAAQPVVSSLIEDGVVDPIFEGRPQAWDDENAAKFIILMTDGANTSHREIRHGDYNHEDTDVWRSQDNADYWDERRCRSGNDCYTRTVVNGRRGDDRLQDVCAAAKLDIEDTSRDRIIVFTIGFKVSNGSNPYYMMRDCASSASKFYHVEDADLTTVFAQIASSIAKLKLTN